MPRLFIFLVIACALLSAACSKNNNKNESILYGTWVKGTNAGDTLWFMEKNGKSIMRSNQSFNAGLPVYTEEAYNFRNDKLIREVVTIDSFKWIEPGKKFELLGFQLFFFMSSTQTKFTYTKVD